MTCTNLLYHPRVSCPSLHGLLPFLPLFNVLDIQPGFPDSLTACTFFFFFNGSIADVQYYVSFRCTTKWFTIFLSYVPFIVIVKYWLCLNLLEPSWHWLLLSAGRTNCPPHLSSTPVSPHPSLDFLLRNPQRPRLKLCCFTQLKLTIHGQYVQDVFSISALVTECPQPSVLSAF